jgi:hypothetical protein
VPLRKVPVSWTTGVGGSGVSVFYTLESTDVTVELATFFNAIKALFPTQVSWQIPSTGDTVDIPTGKIVSGWSGGTAATVVGSTAGAYVGGTGAMVRWNTSGIVDGRHVKGRTFLAPLITTAFDSQGTIGDAQVTTMQNAAVILAGSGKLIIFSRPTKEEPTSGASSLVTGATVPDRVTSLRTRRS